MHVSHSPEQPVSEAIGFDQFLAVDIRVGTIVAAEPFPEAPVHPSKRKAADAAAADASVDHGEYLTEDAHDGASSSNKRAKTSTEDYDTYAGSN